MAKPYNCKINFQDNTENINHTIKRCISYVDDVKKLYLDEKDKGNQEKTLNNITKENVKAIFKLIEEMIRIPQQNLQENKKFSGGGTKKKLNVAVSTNNYYVEIIECLFSNMIEYYIHVLESVLKISNEKINPEKFIEQTMDCLNFKKSIENIKCLIQKIVKLNFDLYLSSHYANNSNKYAPNTEISALFGVNEYIRAGILVLVVFVLGIECNRSIEFGIRRNKQKDKKQVKDSNRKYDVIDNVKHERFNVLFEHDDDDDLLSENICNKTDINVLYRALVKNIQELIRVSNYDVSVLKHTDYLINGTLANEKTTTGNKCGSNYNNIYNFMTVIGSNRRYYYMCVLHLFNKDIDIEIQN